MGNKIEDIKREKDGLDVLDDIHRYARLGFDAIPPDEYERMKWYGVFHRSQTRGFFMMRLRIPNGVLSSLQMRILGEIVQRYCRNAADITTRQNLQIRWLRIEDIPEVFDALHQAGIEHRQSGMDNVRNVTGCPIAGLDPTEVMDASPVARAIEHAIVGLREYSNLPRKFNISVSGCRRDCAMSQIHDIGLTPAVRDGVIGFNVRLAGAMGGKAPRFACDLDAFVTPEQAPRLCTAILTIFRDHGPRENRQRARLKWLIEDWGQDRFRDELQSHFGPLLGAGKDQVDACGEDHLGVIQQRQPGLVAVGCLVPVGRITGADLVEFARLADVYGSGELRLTNDQNVLVVNVPQEKLDKLLAEDLLQKKYPAGTDSWIRRTVSCTGSDYCHFSLIDTKARAVELAQAMDKLAPASTAHRVHWSGCPHACGQHHIGDIGLQGARIRIGDEIVDAADVFIGGRLGQAPKLAERVMEGVPLTELPQRLATLLNERREVLSGSA